MNLFKLVWKFIIVGLAITILTACVRSMATDIEPWQPSLGVSTLTPEPTTAVKLPVAKPRTQNEPVYSPTPDNPHPIPGLRDGEEQYIVQAGDTVGQIAERFNVSIFTISEANQLTDVNVLSIGQLLIIPAPNPTATGPDFKIIPDSELVAGPLTADFDIAGYIQEKNGYLNHHQEDVDGQILSGKQIVKQVARDYSVNPRILLTVLEYQSKWVTEPNPRTGTLQYPMDWKDPWREGLYNQLAWAANNLNRGFYWWRNNAVASWTLVDNSVVPIDPTLNAGTAAVQYLFSLLYGYKTWENTVTSVGLFSVYDDLFGYPFDYSYEPLLPDDLSQPSLQLPFEPGIKWAYTGGPHGGWADGSSWAALDFAPYVDTRGCYVSDEWVVAMADGLIVRTKDGAVVQDLDNDGNEQTGWTILYMHIESRDRVTEGTYLNAGERIGHPSCEGGFTLGTHVHVARRFNGEWIFADGRLPFVLDGWVSSSAGNEYDGYLQNGSATREAFNGNVPLNAIQR